MIFLQLCKVANGGSFEVCRPSFQRKPAACLVKPFAHNAKALWLILFSLAASDNALYYCPFIEKISFNLLFKSSIPEF